MDQSFLGFKERTQQQKQGNMTTDYKVHWKSSLNKKRTLGNNLGKTGFAKNCRLKYKKREIYIFSSCYP